MLYINVPNMNDSVSNIRIEGKEYKIRFTYNEKFDYWSFGIMDKDNNPIIAMTKIVPNFPIFHYYTDTNIPQGIFGCISDKQTVGRNAFTDKTAEFIFIPLKELEE